MRPLAHRAAAPALWLLLVLAFAMGFGFLFGLAFAQEAVAAEPQHDIAAWFGSTAALAGIVVMVVSFLKTHLLKNLHDLATVGVSLGVGAALGIVGHLFGFLAGGIPAAVSFGLAAGFLASGGWDAVTGLLGKPRPAG